MFDPRRKPEPFGETEMPQVILESTVAAMALEHGVKPSSVEQKITARRIPGSPTEFWIFSTAYTPQGEEGSQYWLGIAVAKNLGGGIWFSYETKESHGARAMQRKKQMAIATSDYM